MFPKAADLYSGDKLNVVSFGENATEVIYFCKYSTETPEPTDNLMAQWSRILLLFHNLQLIGKMPKF